MLLLLLACADVPADSKSPVDSDTAPIVEDVPRGALEFRWPLPDPSAFYQTTGVDHDPAEYEGIQQAICTNYDGRTFPWCYDGHDGSDYLLTGSFDAMDAGSQPILAAIDGVVVETDDGHYDRCHAVVDGIDCDGHDGEANYVILEHEGGYRTKYWHMMTDSVIVEVGDTVTCGQQIGTVGSSGYSSAPHLHFEVEDPDGVVFDPYAGEYSQPETWWVEQGDPEGFPGMDCAG